MGKSVHPDAHGGIDGEHILRGRGLPSEMEGTGDSMRFEDLRK